MELGPSPHVALRDPAGDLISTQEPAPSRPAVHASTCTDATLPPFDQETPPMATPTESR